MEKRRRIHIVSVSITWPFVTPFETWALRQTDFYSWLAFCMASELKDILKWESVRCKFIEHQARRIKGELKAEISNFSNIFFAKSNISEVTCNFVKLFSLVYCFLRENYVRSWIFPAFATSSLWAQKLNQQPAVTYEMGKRDNRNQEKEGKHKWCTAIHHYG